MALTASDGTRYERAGGEGPAVVLIHGLGLNRRMWQWQIDAIAPRYRVITYDLFGHGESPPPPSRPCLSLFSTQLKNLLDDLGIDRAAVAGFSLGGMIARRFAMDHGDRLWALAILNSAHKRTPAAQSAVENRLAQVQRDGPSAMVASALERWFTNDFRTSNPELMDLVRTWVMANDKTIYPAVYQVLADGVEELVAPEKPITCPTLVMTAGDDAGQTPEMSRAIASEIPDAKTVILSGLRHLAMVEAPDAYNKELVEFFDAMSSACTKVAASET